MKTSVSGAVTAGALFLLPFVTSNSVFYGSINAKFFFLILLTEIIALTVAFRLFSEKKSIPWRGRWLLGGLGIFLISLYASTFAGIFPERSLWSDIFWSSGTIFLTHMAVLGVLLAELLNERDWSTIRRAIAFGAGFAALGFIIGVRGFGLTGNILWVPLGETSLTFGNETYAGIYLLLGLILGLIEFFRMKKWSKSRTALMAAILLIGFSPILLNVQGIPQAIVNPTGILGAARASSATMLLMAAFLSAYMFLRRFLPSPWNMRLALTWAGVVVAGIGVAIGLLFTPGSSVQNAYIETSTAARPILWESSLSAVKERPILGWGPENFNYAIERYFDSRLFLDKNFGEIWFERAHNIFIDTLISTGVAGAVTHLLLFAIYFFVVYRAFRRDIIEHMEAVLLFALPFAHLLQLQTGFDTISSYGLLAIVGGYALWLERRMAVANNPNNAAVRKIVGSICAAGALISLVLVLLPEYGRQTAVPLTFRTQGEEQAEYLEKSLSRTSSFESLRLSSASFIKGSLSVLAKERTPERDKKILEFAKIYEKHYQAYLTEQPNHYRARMNYAYLLLIMTVLGDNRVSDAKAVIEDSYALSPGNPLTFILDALAELYRGNLDESDKLMEQALAVNPEIEFSQEAQAYFKKQRELFPNITVLRLVNL